MNSYYVVMSYDSTFKDVVFAKYNFKRHVFYDYQLKRGYTFDSQDDKYQDMDIGYRVQKKDNHYKIISKDAEMEVVESALALLNKYRHLQASFDRNANYDTEKLIMEAFIERDYIDPYIFGIVNLVAQAMNLKVRRWGEIKWEQGARVEFPEQVMEIARALYEIFSDYTVGLIEPLNFNFYYNGKKSVSYKNLIWQVELLSGCPLSLYTDDLDAAYTLEPHPVMIFYPNEVIYYPDINNHAVPAQRITPEICAERYKSLAI